MIDSHSPSDVECGPQLTLTALPGIPSVQDGDDLAELIVSAVKRAEIDLADQDVLLVTSKIVSRAEGCFVDLSTVKPSEKARSLADEVEKDPRLVELILADSERVSRSRPGVLIVRHRLGFVSANAAIDASNAAPKNASEETGPWVLTMPRDPDRSAATIRESIVRMIGADVAVMITDSLGRPFRVGTIGHAVGVAGLPPICDHRGRLDLYDREILTSTSAVADQLSAVSDLLAGQSSEGRPVIHARGLKFANSNASASELYRDPEQDLYL